MQFIVTVLSVLDLMRHKLGLYAKASAQYGTMALDKGIAGV